MDPDQPTCVGLWLGAEPAAAAMQRDLLKGSIPRSDWWRMEIRKQKRQSSLSLAFFTRDGDIQLCVDAGMIGRVNLGITVLNL